MQPSMQGIRSHLASGTMLKGLDLANNIEQTKDPEHEGKMVRRHDDESIIINLQGS